MRFQEDILKKIDRTIKDNDYNSRTEFIRDAVRDKLEEIRKKEALKELAKLYGSVKRKTSYKE